MPQITNDYHFDLAPDQLKAVLITSLEKNNVSGYKVKRNGEETIFGVVVKAPFPKTAKIAISVKPQNSGSKFTYSGYTADFGGSSIYSFINRLLDAISKDLKKIYNYDLDYKSFDKNGTLVKTSLDRKYEKFMYVVLAISVLTFGSAFLPDSIDFKYTKFVLVTFVFGVIIVYKFYWPRFEELGDEIIDEYKEVFSDETDLS